MHFRCTAKSASYRLSIAGRAVLALALAIGASGAIFTGGGLRSMPFFDDAQIENADVTTEKADSADMDSQKSNKLKEAAPQPGTRKSDYNGKARPKRSRGIMLSANRFILERQLQSEQDSFDSAAAGFLIPGGLNLW